jgi:hypothetical protein
MRYLNEFEEFDPKDFEDFEIEKDDMRTLGFMDRLEPGKDFGCGLDLKGEPNGERSLYFTQEGLDFLERERLVKVLRPGHNYRILHIIGKYQKNGMSQSIYGYIRKKSGTDLYYLEMEGMDGKTFFPPQTRSGFRKFRPQTIIGVQKYLLDEYSKPDTTK